MAITATVSAIQEGMAIPEAQLETWCNQGAIVTSASAYTSIKTAIWNSKSKIATRNPDVYLQGSYGNSTNIFADSDVDVVVQLSEPWGRDISGLPDYQQQLYLESVVDATYAWRQFHADTVSTLQSYFGAAAVKPGNKAVLVTLPSGRTADVIPSFLYRKYKFFQAQNVQSYVSGIKFEDNAGRTIVNFPKEHITNGEAKNSKERTAFRYKQTVRMFKNARNTAIDRGLLKDGTAPSYFVECLLYNVPDALFVADRQLTFINVLDYANTKLPVDGALCQNGQLKLFGETPEQWKVQRAGEFLQSLINLWNHW